MTPHTDTVHPAAAQPGDPPKLARIAVRTKPAPARVDEQLTSAPVSGWRTVGREQAAHVLAGRGVDLDTARAMVTDYLRDTSARAGTPAYRWGLDQADIAAIADTHHLHSTDAAADTGASIGAVIDDGHDSLGWAR